MDKIPPTYIDFCKTNGIPELQINQYWLEIITETVTELLTYIVNDLDLNEIQLAQLQKIFNISIKSGKTYNLVETIEMTLGDAQRVKVQAKYEQLFLSHLDKFYSDHK
jgi:hypothetical protein